MSSEDPDRQDQPPVEPGGGERYGNPYGGPAGAPPPYGGSYGGSSYPRPDQPSGYPPPPPPQWGQPAPQGYPYGGPAGGPVGPVGPHVPPQSDGLALGAMIVGIVSLVLTCGYGIGLLGSPAALVLGRISMKRIDRSGGRLGGRGMAQAGFVLGIIGTVLLVLAIAAIVVFIVVAANGGFDDGGSTTYDYNS
jgi:hypothetical protein